MAGEGKVTAWRAELPGLANLPPPQRLAGGGAAEPKNSPGKEQEMER